LQRASVNCVFAGISIEKYQQLVASFSNQDDIGFLMAMTNIGERQQLAWQ